MTKYISRSYRLDPNYDDLCYVISDTEAEVKTVGVLLGNHYTAEVDYWCTFGINHYTNTTTTGHHARDNLLEGRLSIQHNQSDS